MAEGSSRGSRVAGALLGDAYALLDAVGAIDPGDASRLAAVGVRRDAISITGDTRYDQVWQRCTRVDRASPLLARLTADRPTVVAGSTWPSDEAVLLPSFARIAEQVPGARLIVAPHEPTSAHLEPIEQWTRTAGLSFARLGAADATAAVVLVDRVGVLGDLYALADVAFVGGGFHDAGLHSVLEPAAFGIPVLFGPRHAMSRDARLLLARGGARSVADSEALTRSLSTWLGDRVSRQTAGRAARDLVQSGLGAAERSLRLVEGLLGVT